MKTFDIIKNYKNYLYLNKDLNIEEELINFLDYFHSYREEVHIRDHIRNRIISRIMNKAYYFYNEEEYYENILERIWKLNFIASFYKNEKGSNCIDSLVINYNNCYIRTISKE